LARYSKGVNVTANGTFHCFNRSNMFAPTTIKANDKAVAHGCHGNHAMNNNGTSFMAGVNHSSCDQKRLSNNNTHDMHNNHTDTKSSQNMSHCGDDYTKYGKGDDKRSDKDGEGDDKRSDMGDGKANDGNMPSCGNMTKGNMTRDDKNKTIIGRPNVIGMTPGEAFRARKDASDKKREDANTKQAEATEKKRDATIKRGAAVDQRRLVDAKKNETKTKKAAARKSRDSMLGNMTNAKHRAKASLLADAAIAGRPIKKIKANFTAANETEACVAIRAAMNISDSVGVCEVSTKNFNALQPEP
jgi:hypothetical protein